MNKSALIDNLDGSEIAVIGIACRFPGAKNLNEFWQNLYNGVESISFLTKEEINPSGVDPAQLDDPNYVNAASILEDVELFDAAFFGYTPREAETMDPQQRLFLETAWQALEHAGYNPETYQGAIGVYAGARTNTYLFNIVSNRNLVNALGAFEIGLGNDLAFLSTRVSYKLNLKGPSYSVHTACSTSLVAVHLACQSLLMDECQMALAGGVAVNVPQKTGYLYQHGGILSPDGHCRTFDANAKGTIFGSGVSVIVLKQLADAIRDGDFIHAVIRGSATNNDGSQKASFTAPSVYGQTEVILEALANAGITPDTISYVETHGTGTALGDPIELRALTRAFGNAIGQQKYCAIGSVKSNFGHLDAAAGMASLVKTILALQHKMLPPSLHFTKPNPNIDFEYSPFFVNTELREWHRSATPRRAAVSSFGVGGTNAHVILEEAPHIEECKDARPWQLLLLSAKTETALQKATINLVDYFQQQPTLDLADAAFTLQMGRYAFNHRRMLVCQSVNDAIDALTTCDPQRIYTAQAELNDRPVVFMFPGGGAQYVNMGEELYRTEPLFREHVDRCAELLKSQVNYDLRELLYPAQEQLETVCEKLKKTSFALPALFVIEYALAQLWIYWGVRPQALIGHSLGEYTAACLAGVFSLEDALALVVLRGQLFEQLPSGSMLSVPLSAGEVQTFLNKGLSLAAINAPGQSVVSGTNDAIDELADLLISKDIEFRRLQIDVAAHSDMVTPILPLFREFVEQLPLQKPQIPFLSNVTGTWISDQEATDPAYWVKHLRETVRFADGIKELIKNSSRLLLEVGPGQTLSTLAKLQVNSARLVHSSIRHPYEKRSDVAFLLTTLGKLWLAGAKIDWAGFYLQQERRRVPLPTYPFERQRYWVEAKESLGAVTDLVAHGKRLDISSWFYLPSWKRSLPSRFVKIGELATQPRRWLILSDQLGVSRKLLTRLREEQQQVVNVEMAERFAKIDIDTYTINPCNRDDYETLLIQLRSTDRMPEIIVHLCSLTPLINNRSQQGMDFFHQMQEQGLYSLLFLAQALAKESPSTELHIEVVANQVREVSPSEATYPEKATILAPCQVICQENPNISCHFIDVILPEATTVQVDMLVNQILAEIIAKPHDLIVAYRDRQRWVQSYEQVQIDGDAKPIRPLQENGVYLITGGMGGIGLLLANYLARTVKAKLILAGRTDFPDKEAWQTWLATHDEQDKVSNKIRKLQALEQLNAEVWVTTADVTNEEQMHRLICQIYDRFGQLNGVLHTAGITSGASIFNPITEIGPSELAEQFQPKGQGLYVLEKVLREREIDFCLLFSSNASILGGMGFIAYSAANLFMDSFAAYCRRMGKPWISANWDPWPAETRKYTEYQTSMDQYTMTIGESEEAFRRIVSMVDEGQLVVSTGELHTRLKLWINRDLTRSQTMEGAFSAHPRPNLSSVYVAPRDDMEETIARLWQELLAVEEVGIFDNFFELGGHSLLATRIVGRLRDTFQIDLPLRKLFEMPTVVGLALSIKELQAQEQEQEKIEILNKLAQLSEEDVTAEIEKRMGSIS
ncbi:MAG: SDR family NAD(P)-dependent oxidoreductase [Acidobacteriota bacterium]